MSEAILQRLIEEGALLPERTTDDGLENLRRAIAIEDALGIVLSDDAISNADLTDAKVLLGLLAARQAGP